MNKEIKEKWLAALRSGNYEQGQGQMCVISPSGVAKYCCLGVLEEEVQGEDSWVQDSPIATRDGVSTDMFTSTGGLGHPSSDTMDRSDIDQKAATFLVNANDNLRWSFNAIASWIEANL